MTHITLIQLKRHYNNSRKIGVIMSKENKKQVYTMILKLNLILGIYNLFLFSIGNLFINLLIGSLNIGVWTFFRDKTLIAVLKSNKIKSHIK